MTKPLPELQAVEACIVEMLGDRSGKWRVICEPMDEAHAVFGAIMIYQQTKWPVRVRRVNSTHPILEI